MSSRRLHTPIENPTLELKIVSANDVSHIDATDKMDVYAVVSMNGGTTQKKQSAKTPIDYDGGPNPTWNHTVRFSVSEREANHGLLTIKVKLYSYWLENENDPFMGEVNVSVQDLLASNPLPPFANGNVNKMKLVTYPVKVTGDTKPDSKLSLAYRFKPVPVDDLYPPAPDHLPSFGQHIYPNPDPARSGHPLVFPSQFQTASAKLILELVIKFAKDIKDVNSFSAMDVYASVVILKDNQTKHRINTPVAVSAYKNPKWNYAVKFFLDEKLGREGRLTLLIELWSRRLLLGDKDIGKVKLPIQELLGSNPPFPSNNGGDAIGMKLETHALRGHYGKKGTVSFTYRFLTEQVTVPPLSTAPQPYVMYIPASHQSYPIQGSLENMTIQSGVNAGPSNGLLPIYMASPYQLHGHQQHSSPQPQPQHSNFQPLPQPQPDAQPQPYTAPPYQQYSSSEPLPEQRPQPTAPQQPTHLHAHSLGGGTGALELGAAVLGRVIGGALLSGMTSDEVNIYDFQS